MNWKSPLYASLLVLVGALSFQSAFAEEVPLADFSLAGGASQVVQVRTTEKTTIIASTDLEASEVDRVCPTTGTRVKVAVCVRLIQENFDLGSTGQKGGAQSVGIGTSGGTTFHPVNGLIKLRVENQTSRNIKVTLARKLS